MDRTVKGKIVVVTGGAQGLGRSIVEKFLQHGAAVVIALDIKEEEGNATVNELNKKHNEGKAVFIKCDVTKDLEKVSSEIINTYKNVDILVNNAGSVIETSIRETLELNLLALIEWSMMFFEHMRIDKGGKGGTILNMSSISGFRAHAFGAFYAASKHGVLGFTKTQGHPKIFETSGVRIVGICPGFTKTELTRIGDVFINDEIILDHMKTALWQEPDAVGEAAVEIIKTADTGTSWLIEGGNPIEQVL